MSGLLITEDLHTFCFVVDIREFGAVRVDLTDSINVGYLVNKNALID